MSDRMVQFGEELRSLCQKYNLENAMFSGNFQDGDRESVCMAKIGEDVPTALAVFGLLVCNIPDIHLLFNQVVFHTYLDEYNKLRERVKKDAPKSGRSILDEFVVKGKFKN